MDLAAAGLNLSAIVPVASLEPALRRQIKRKRHEKTLLLVGHGGQALWKRLSPRWLKRPDPIDEYSVSVIERALGRLRPPIRWRRLFPGSSTLPLQLLGQSVGWAQKSPLGSGINARFGLWFAYRGAYLLDRRLPRIVWRQQAAPCRQCPARPCLAACPAEALTVEQPPDVLACARHRVAPASECALRCLARDACPVGSRHRYPDAAVAYHYGHSLRVLRTMSHKFLR